MNRMHVRPLCIVLPIYIIVVQGMIREISAMDARKNFGGVVRLSLTSDFIGGEILF